jgi:tetratricopeptide (TPR) repeat protein
MRLLHAGLLTAALVGAASFTPASAMSINSPQLQSADPATQSQPAPTKDKTTTKRKKPPQKKSELPDKKSELPFVEGYRLAHTLIYRQQDYGRAIAVLTALDRGDHPDVANLIGFASRKLGRTEDAKVWYEKALAADPRHARTWQYYGMWHLERGDRAKAESYLETIQAICGTGCEEYTSLKLALADDGTLSY